MIVVMYNIRYVCFAQGSKQFSMYLHLHSDFIVITVHSKNISMNMFVLDNKIEFKFYIQVPINCIRMLL